MESRHRYAMATIGLLGALAMPMAASAATVGLWLFNDLADVNGEDPGGLLTSDSSGNDFDFVSHVDPNPDAVTPSSLSLSSDRPSVIPAGTSLASNFAAALVVHTEATSSSFHRGSTGELTIEYWFKSVRVTPSVAYIASFSGGNGNGTGTQYIGDWGAYYNSLQEPDVMRFFDYSTTQYPEVGVNVDPQSGWHHYAFTADQGGNLRSYLDGVLISQNLGTRAPAPALADIFRFGSNVAGTFGNHDFLIDELRVSDVALLPGDGTGDGELAWNASLDSGGAMPGDFNGDNVVDVTDVDMLCAAIRAGGPADPYNVDGNNGVNLADLEYHIEQIIGTSLGDSDLDDDVDLSDLGNLATNYEQSPPRTWGQGDFDCDQDVDLSDLGTLATNYSGGQASAYAEFSALTGVEVPEPASISVLAPAMGVLCAHRRRKGRQQ